MLQKFSTQLILTIEYHGTGGEETSLERLSSPEMQDPTTDDIRGAPEKILTREID